MTLGNEFHYQALYITVAQANIICLIIKNQS